MKRDKLIDILRYKFDNLMAKGTIALVGILFLATTAVIIVAGIIAFLLGEGSIGPNIWLSVMHVVDAGNIACVETTNIAFVALMSVVTLCGIFITSILIGIITTGFEEKLNNLKKGNGKVIEKDHTLILGFNDNVYTIISELVAANENKKDASIVILTDEEKETVESEIAKQLLDLKTTRVICRTGSISDTHMLRQCSIEKCKSIIINVQDDFMVTKTILAINNFFSASADSKMKAHIVATVHDNTNYEAVQIAGEGNVETILMNDAISRIIAQTCRQPGLSNVLIELFDYSGNELYFETFPQLAGISFGDVLNYFDQASVFGYKRDGKIFLNPAKDVKLESADELLLLVEDDGMAKPLDKAPTITNLDSIAVDTREEDEPENVLILGTNSMLNRILTELNGYFKKGSRIVIAAPSVENEMIAFTKTLENLNIESIECDINRRSNLDKLIDKNIENVLLLSDDSCDVETSDSMILLRLIHLRDIAQKESKVFNITSEMRNTTNQKLAHVAKVNDLVVGSNIINLILTQISENRDLATIFRELLQVDGSEIYLRKASNYVKLGEEVDYYAITEIAKNRDEIAIGYKRQIGDTFEIITSPLKSEKIKYGKDDYIVVLAND